MLDPVFSRRHLLSFFAGSAALAVSGAAARAAHPRITRLIEKAAALPSISARIDFISRALIGTPYRSSTLVGGPRKPEQFVSRDDAFDCVTFCEAVLAAAMVRTPASYESTLRQIRYRSGTVLWRERNHYFSQWCENNIASHHCRPVAVPGMETTAKLLSWMPELGARRMPIVAVPRASLLANKDLIAIGDIIGFVSERPRLDYFHIGFVIVAPNGELLLRHAAQSKRRVLDEPLSRFLAVNRVKAVTLLRPMEPKEAVARI